LAHLGIEEHTGPSQAMDRALGACVKDGNLERLSKGLYRLPPTTSGPSATQDDEESNGPDDQSDEHSSQAEGGAGERSSSASPRPSNTFQKD
jgi:hypothetical protein